ncbi:hypothetical protein Mgra_00002013, partial [Meloidogyne graminicola]
QQILNNKKIKEYYLGKSFILKYNNSLRLPFYLLNIKFLIGENKENCLIGPSGNILNENIHWSQMIKQSNTPIAMWHKLNPIIQ